MKHEVPVPLAGMPEFITAVIHRDFHFMLNEITPTGARIMRRTNFAVNDARYDLLFTAIDDTSTGIEIRYLPLLPILVSQGMASGTNVEHLLANIAAELSDRSL